MADLIPVTYTRSSDRELAISPEGEWARTHLALRRKRDSLFGAAMFGDPAWEILLMLFVAHQEGRYVTVSNLCRETAAPATTVHRWLLALIGDRLVVRIGDPHDRRRSYVYLSAVAVQKMQALFLETIGQDPAGEAALVSLDNC